MTLWPPQACPCGRPRAEGTYVESTQSGAIVFVVFYHTDGTCSWRRAPWERRFRHEFLPRAA